MQLRKHPSNLVMSWFIAHMICTISILIAMFGGSSKVWCVSLFSLSLPCFVLFCFLSFTSLCAHLTFFPMRVCAHVHVHMWHMVACFALASVCSGGCIWARFARATEFSFCLWVQVSEKWRHAHSKDQCRVRRAGLLLHCGCALLFHLVRLKKREKFDLNTNFFILCHTWAWPRTRFSISFSLLIISLSLLISLSFILDLSQFRYVIIGINLFVFLFLPRWKLEAVFFQIIAHVVSICCCLLSSQIRHSFVLVCDYVRVLMCMCICVCMYVYVYMYVYVCLECVPLHVRERVLLLV